MILIFEILSPKNISRKLSYQKSDKNVKTEKKNYIYQVYSVPFKSIEIWFIQPIFQCTCRQLSQIKYRTWTTIFLIDVTIRNMINS